MKKFGIVVMFVTAVLTAAQCITSTINYTESGKNTDLGFAIGLGFVCLFAITFCVGMIMVDELTRRLGITKP